MTFLSVIPDPLLRMMKLINEYTTKELGGSIEWMEYKDIQIVKMRWKKLTNNGHRLQLEVLMTYEELAHLTDPRSIAKKFVDLYNERVKEDG